MSEELTKAAVNLFAVLRNLEVLCRLDPESAALVQGKSFSIRFSIHGGPSAYLNFKDGQCVMNDSPGPSPVVLYFRSPGHFNGMINGTASPIPLRGFTKLGLLRGEFTALTKRLDYYLRPDDEKLADPFYYELNTRLLLHTAVYALACIGNYDALGRQIARRIPDGILAIRIEENGEELFLHAEQGHLSVLKAATAAPSALMIFDTVRSANEVLSEKANLFELIVTEQLRIKGKLPMVQHMSDILAKVPAFVS
jgi:hypothetical protein